MTSNIGIFNWMNLNVTLSSVLLWLVPKKPSTQIMVKAGNARQKLKLNGISRTWIYDAKNLKKWKIAKIIYLVQLQLNLWTVLKLKLNLISRKNFLIVVKIIGYPELVSTESVRYISMGRNSLFPAGNKVGDVGLVSKISHQDHSSRQHATNDVRYF